MASKLLAVGTTNAKTAKNTRPTAIMYLAPHTQNSKGVNVCPKASAGCAAACLYNAGRGKFNSVQQARIGKTDRYLSDKKQFSFDLLHELTRLNIKAGKSGTEIAVRLNGTSDIDFIYLIKKFTGVDVLDKMQNLVFYDYTKMIAKVKRYQPVSHRYKLTFSKAEDNDADVMKALQLGAPVSVVFSTSKDEALPTTWNGYRVVDGDSSDDQMIDYDDAVILGLRFKGSKAERVEAINSGFVIQA
jgi:hypothetical protein